MNITSTILNSAIKEAEKSTCLKRVGAVIFNKKIIVSRGHNYTLKSARKLHPKYMRYKGPVHAEMDAILKAKTNLKGMNILVVRLGFSGKLRYSKPCKYCQKYLRATKIKHAYYISRNGDINRMEL